MYSNPAVDHGWSATEFDCECFPCEGFPCEGDTLQSHFACHDTGRNRGIPKWQSPLCGCSTKVYQELLVGVRPSVPAGALLAVDRPLHLRETPAPFTSRSPDIATLGPSWTPDRQLSLFVDLPARLWFGCRSAHVIRIDSWLVRDAGGNRTHFHCFAGSCLAIGLQRHRVSQPGIEPDPRASHARVLSGTLQGRVLV